MLELIIKFAIIWMSIDLVILATTWYLWGTIRVYYPDWWYRVIVDGEPNVSVG